MMSVEEIERQPSAEGEVLLLSDGSTEKVDGLMETPEGLMERAEGLTETSDRITETTDDFKKSPEIKGKPSGDNNDRETFQTDVVINEDDQVHEPAETTGEGENDEVGSEDAQKEEDDVFTLDLKETITDEVSIVETKLTDADAASEFDSKSQNVIDEEEDGDVVASSDANSVKDLTDEGSEEKLSVFSSDEGKKNNKEKESRNVGEPCSQEKCWPKENADISAATAESDKNCDDANVEILRKKSNTSVDQTNAPRELPNKPVHHHQPPPTVTPQIPRLHRHRTISRQSTLPSVGRTNSTSSAHLSRSRRESMEDEEGDAGGASSEQQQQQYVVNVHVNPGETFSVCVSDQVQLIQGPATVRMVSNNGPPLPMPMQVPPGHMVQQIIDENGILTNVILSSQPPGLSVPPVMSNPAGTPPHHIYSPYGPHYPPYLSQTGQYTMHHHPHPMSHMHHMAPPRMCAASPPHCNSHGHPPAPPPPTPHMHPTTVLPPPIHPHNMNHMAADDRGRGTGGGGGSKGRPQNNHRTYLKYKNINRVGGDSTFYVGQRPLPHLPQHSRITIPHMNGIAGQRHSESSSIDDAEMEEERQVIREQLSKIQAPQVLEIEARSALIILTPPEVNQQEFQIDSSEFQYELHLSERKEGKYNLVYSGDATEITLRDLKPATEYHLKVHSILDDQAGNPSDCVSFTTISCEPDAPQSPKLVSKTISSLSLKWNPAIDNGSTITSYCLEYDHGNGDMNFTEIYQGIQRQFKLSKLNPATGYTFRLAACNAHGRSEYSRMICHSTSGTAPTQPDPPMMSECFVTALTVSWIRRPNDDRFTLQMMDEDSSGRGFVLVYNGPNLSFTVSHLHRNTDYKFKLQASNDEGNSPWSDVVKFRTLPDKPQPPPRPQVKGKVQSHSFSIVWDLPRDNGGVEISHYLVQLDCGNGFETVQSSLEREFTASRLEPGHTYWLRVACANSEGQSEWCDVVSVITQAVPPGPCTGLRLSGKPQANSLHIRWAMPEFTGGAPFSDYEVLMTNSDNSTSEVYRGPDTDCTVTGLLPGRNYLFQVRCLNRAGAGPWSDSLEVMSGAIAPDPPTQPVVTCKSPHLAHISWTEPASNGAHITEYRLEWQQRDTEFSQLYCGPSVTAEVNGLLAATMYSFRVQAVNCAGAGPFSATASCVTPPSNPGVVTSVRASSTATSIHVSWREPNDNGSKINGYYISVDDRSILAVDNVLDYVIDDLQPETIYRIRVQATNSIGLGAFSSPVKVTTRSLPPRPPFIDCVTVGYNSLKLKWRDARYQTDLIQYCLEMLRDDGSFHPVYQGSGHSYKVNKLNELTQYEFRIYASNEAGDGPYSETFKFETSKAPPPVIKGPKVSYITIDSCMVEWPALKPMAQDSIYYILQMQSIFGRDQSFKEMYRGPSSTHKINGLAAGLEYRLRVCAVRQSRDCDEDLVGSFSQTSSFVTSSLKSPGLGSVLGSSQPKSSEKSKWSDQQWAVVLLLCFALFAIFIAFLAQLIISHMMGGEQTTDHLPHSDVIDSQVQPNYSASGNNGSAMV